MTEYTPASRDRLLSVAEAARIYTEYTGQPCSERQMRRWASADRRGRRRLPFTICPLSERLMITEAGLVESAVRPFHDALRDWRRGRG